MHMFSMRHVSMCEKCIIHIAHEVYSAVSGLILQKRCWDYIGSIR